MARASRLKVYRAAAGFEDAYVAAPSQAAALKAWGATTDLFAHGEASVVTDPELIAEPLAHPGRVVRRPRGGLAAMLAAAPKPKPTGPPKPVAQTAEKAASRRKAPAPPLKVSPDRSALNAAEKALAAASERLAHDLEAIAQERADLDDQETRTRREGNAEVKRLDKARAKAERAFRRAGGT